MRLTVLLCLVLIVLVSACARTDNKPVTPPATIRLAQAATQQPAAPAPEPTLLPIPTEPIVTPAVIQPTPSPRPTRTPRPTSTFTPLPTPTSTPILPAESVVFLREGKLQQWLPQSGEVRLLAENVHSRIWPIYSADFATFIRATIPDQEYTLTVLHIPTQAELTVATLPYEPFYLSLSPNPGEGRGWLAYIVGDSWDTATIIVHEILANGQQLSVNGPVLTIPHSWHWPYRELTWATTDQLSWSNETGIWLVDLNTTPIEPVIAIQPSTNIYQAHPITQTEGTVETFTANTIYEPYRWSPDGRYLLAIEGFPLVEGLSSLFRVIEPGTNRSFELPDSALGPISDDAAWLDENTPLHFRQDGSVRIWRILPDSDPFMVLDKSIERVNLPGGAYLNLMPLSNGHVRFNTSRGLFDLDVESGALLKISSNIEETYIQLYWSPSAQHVLWGDSHIENDEVVYTVFLDYLNGDAPVDMSSILGGHSCCWHWYQE